MPLPPRPMGGASAGPRPPMSPSSGPTGPGATPATAPGAGAGNQAAATALVSKAFDVLKAVFQGFPNGSKEQQAVMRAMTALNPLFGNEKAAELGGAAGRQLTAMGAPGNPLAGTPSPGIQSAMPPMPPGGAGPNGPGAM